MSGTERLAEDHVRRLAEASAWRVALSEADQLTSEGFEAWITADPENEAAWDEVQSSWALVGDFGHSPELLALRREALARAGRPAPPRKSATARLLRIAAAIALVVSIAATYTHFSAPGGQRPLTYATALGERRVVTLDDGSKISLDAASEVAVAYAPAERRLVLLRGQARFDVAHAAERPFIVQAGGRTVVATGTAFTVDLLGEKVVVTLIEGKVVVLDRKDLARDEAQRLVVAARTRRPPPETSGVAVAAGQQLSLVTAAPPEIESVDLAKATAWEQGQLVFEDEPLSEVAARVSRYAPQAVTVAPGASTLRISGVFNAGDVATFTDTVGRYLPVRVVRQQGGALLITRAD